MPLHLVGISGNQLWHTIRRAGGWDPWDQLLASAGPLPSSPMAIACGFAGGQLHVCVGLMGERLFHTIRFGAGNWQPWGDATNIVAGVRFDGNFDCVGMGNSLNVCIEGRRSPLTGQPPAVWWQARVSDPAGDFWTVGQNRLTNTYSGIESVTCANVAGNELHILARCWLLTGEQLLMHNIRFADGSEQASGDQDVFAQFPSNPPLLAPGNFSAAGIGPELHIVAAIGGNLFHTIRLNNLAWQATFGPVRPAVDPAFTGPLNRAACANVDGNLHVCATSAGRIVHTIRLSSGVWRNPENAPVGRFGDVLANVPATPGGLAPQASFSDIHCAGE
jgi:hypothetical protein